MKIEKLHVKVFYGQMCPQYWTEVNFHENCVFLNFTLIFSQVFKPFVYIWYIYSLITQRAKLLNPDWMRQRAFFVNFLSNEGKITDY